MDMTRRGAYKAREARALAARRFFHGGRRDAGNPMAEAALAPTQDTDRGASDMGKTSLALRRTMVDCQLRPFDVTDVPILQRFLDVPRELFLPDDLRPLAYSDLAISLKNAAGRKTRTLLPPLHLARFLQGADIRRRHRVLDIAGGAGYPAALLSGLAAEVVALESDPELAAKAKANLAAIGAANARVETGPLAKGVPGAGPFDVILIHGAVEDGLDALFGQLTPNGHLLAIATADEDAGQQAVRFERSGGRPAGERPLFDASAPMLEGFTKAPAFVF
jgi:protein-L-isoaspartate(D-aspartate) O-methyltransferase